MYLVPIIIWVILSLILIVAIGSMVNIYNSLINLKNNVDKSWKNIDVLLKQRHDELPKIVSVVEAYMKYEKSLLTEITIARSDAIKSRSFIQRQDAENRISKLLNSLCVVSENYPKLKSDKHFLQLQSRISSLENQIADRRELFNESVNNYNIRIETFPEIVLAKIFRYKKKKLLNVPESEKQ